MKRTYTSRLWDSLPPGSWAEDAPMPPAACAFALFRLGQEAGEIIAARGPSASFAPGENLFRQFTFSEELLSSLARGLTRPLFALTDKGVGFFSPFFVPTSGVLLYVHLHAPGDSAARLLCAHSIRGGYDVTEEIASIGASLRRRDEKTLPVLTHVWETWEMIRASLAPTETLSGDPSGEVCARLMLEEVTQALTALASLTGCRIRAEAQPIETTDPGTEILRHTPDGRIPTQTPWYARPVMWRPPVYALWWLCLCGLAYRFAPTRQLFYDVSAQDGKPDGTLRLSVSFSLLPCTDKRVKSEQIFAEAEALLSFLDEVAMWNSAETTHSLRRGQPQETSGLTASITFPASPSFLVTGEIKHPFILE